LAAVSRIACIASWRETKKVNHVTKVNGVTKNRTKSNV